MTTRPRIARRPGPRRAMTWADTLLDETMSVGGSAQISLSSTLDPDERRGATITRLIGCLTFYADDAIEFSGDIALDMGIGVASQEAFTAGATSDVSDSAAVPVRGWLYRCRQIITTGVSTAVPHPLVRWNFDVRSQRRLDTGEPFVLLDPLVLAGTGSVTTVAGSIRMLLKLA